MRFRVTTVIGDGLEEAPPFDFDCGSDFKQHQFRISLGEYVEELLEGDDGVPFGVGGTITIERIL